MAMQNAHAVVFGVFVFAVSTAYAQSGPPPVRMGLWEVTTVHTMAGLNIPPEVVAKLKAMGRPMFGAEGTTVHQSCLTPEQWNKDMAHVQRGDERDCKRSNVVQNSHQMSFDITCARDSGHVTTGHMEMFFDSSEKTHGSIVMKSTQPNQSTPVNINLKINGHFVSSNCGDVKPGEPKEIRNQ